MLMVRRVISTLILLCSSAKTFSQHTAAIAVEPLYKPFSSPLYLPFPSSSLLSYTLFLPPPLLVSHSLRVLFSDFFILLLFSPLLAPFSCRCSRPLLMVMRRYLLLPWVEVEAEDSKEAGKTTGGGRGGG